MWAALVVDNRLQRRKGRRYQKLRRDNLEPLARAIVLVVRQRGRIGIARDHNLSIVELVTPEGMTHVLKEDWAKILPYFQDGTFDRLGLPIDQNVGLAALPPGSVGVTFHLNAGKTARGEINTARGDELFYSRILGILRGLFTEEFPTQDF